MKTLEDKVVVITGAGSGIGRALALRTAGLGSRLALSDVDPEGLAQTARLVRAAGVRALRTDELDVRDRRAVAAYATAVAEQFGCVNVLVNNAGVGFFGDFLDTTYEQFHRVIDANFWGVVHGSKEFLPLLIASGDGHLVNVSSMDGYVGSAAQTQYCASKFAVAGLTESLRQEMQIAH